jgi:hypothetical protein
MKEAERRQTLGSTAASSDAARALLERARLTERRQSGAIDLKRAPFSLFGENRQGISCQGTDYFDAGLNSR